MDRMLYIAMNGAKHALLGQATNSHNLSNANTVGFKTDLDEFKSLPVYGPVLASRVYSEDTRVGTNLNAGPMMTTGRELDVAIQGEGWLTVQATDGSEAYTRAGDLRIDSVGLLTTGAGHPVMGNDGPIAIPPAAKIEIGADGGITIMPPGDPLTAPLLIDRIRLVNPPAGAMAKRQDGLMGVKPGTEVVPDAAVHLASGVLEGSNVNSVDSMVRMIQYARMFETQSKLMQQADANGEATNRLLSLS
ncbi:MAG: flagellar basal body rod protein FlgF [Halothiobacillaceae bacterium]|nr:MAG: flagellar basal body rod protein FlgF [Halothiobacillaceae bacterium]